MWWSQRGRRQHGACAWHTDQYRYTRTSTRPRPRTHTQHAHGHTHAVAGVRSHTQKQKYSILIAFPRQQWFSECP